LIKTVFLKGDETMKKILLILTFVFILLFGQFMVCVVSAEENSGGTLIETIKDIPNNAPVKVTSTTILESGKWYIIEASGTISDWGDQTEGVDAVWCYAEWRCGPDGEVWDQLRIDDKGMTEIAGKTIPYNSSHIYRVKYQGQGKPVVFYCSDAQWSSDGNSGSFSVKIYELPADELRTGNKSFYVRGIGNDGTLKEVKVTFTKRYYDFSPEEAKAELEWEKTLYDPGYDPTMNIYTRIGNCTQKQDCAGYVFEKLWSEQLKQLEKDYGIEGPYWITGQKFCNDILFKFGTKISGDVTWGDAQKGDVVVYGEGGHVAIVREVNTTMGVNTSVVIETKDGVQAVYETTLPNLPSASK